MERVEQADSLLLSAINTVERDPHGTTSLARAQALASISTALLLREMLDRNTTEVDLDEPPNTPW